MSDKTIFLAPCARDVSKMHFENTVLNAGEYGPVWGIPEGQKAQWDKITEDDILLFYMGNFKYKYAAKVKRKEINEQLANKLWTPFKGESGRRGGQTRGPWPYLIYLEKPFEVNISGEEIHGYADHDIDYSQVFYALNKQGHSEIRRKFGSIEEYLTQRKTSDE